LRRRPPGAGRVASCCGARLARVVAPAKGRMGRSPYPLCRARSLPPPQFAINVVAEINRVSHMRTVTLQAAGVQSPAVRSASVGRAVCADLTRRWGRPVHLAPQRARDSAEVVSDSLRAQPSGAASRPESPPASYGRKAAPAVRPKSPGPDPPSSGFKPLAIIPCLSLSLTLQMAERLTQCTKLR
jgi:hypothetical protein